MRTLARSHTRLIRHIGTVPAQLWQCEPGLKGTAGDFDSGCYLSDKAKSEITWWIDNVASVKMVGGQSWKLLIQRVGDSLQGVDGMSTNSWTILMF